MLGIYKIVNLITKDIYVGSSGNINNRKKRHFSQLNCNNHHCHYLQRAYNKYGKENFELVIIEEMKFPEDYDNVLIGQHLISREQYYIDTLKPKYNSSREAGSTKGIILTKEQREQRRQLNLSGVCYKPIYKLDLNFNVIEEYESVKEACEKTNRASTCITDICKGRTKSRYDYSFCYKKDYPLPEERKFKRKIILQYDNEGNFIKEYPTNADLVNAGFNPAAILRVSKGLSEHSKGFKFKIEYR